MNKKNANILFGGHVDHGKSTVVARLLQDSGKTDGGLITDAMVAEQEDSKTIKLGHQKLETDNFSFVLLDAPGHKEFIDQLEKGAKDADAVVLMVAANEGIEEQTISHLEMCSKYDIDNVVVCVNKMDLIAYDKITYLYWEKKIINLLYDTGYGNTPIVPVSAKEGWNISNNDSPLWYNGKPLLALLEEMLTDRPNLGIDELVDKSKKVIEKAVCNSGKKQPTLLWAGGKDSTVMLHIARSMGWDLDVVYINTGFQFKETIDFIIDKQELFGIKSVTTLTTDTDIVPEDGHFACCNERKTKVLKKYIREHDVNSLLVGIRWDEHGIRGKEDAISERKDHIRFHPMLWWSEKEIWEYIKTNDLPYNPLYEPGRKVSGKVFKSIGCEPCTVPVSPDVKSERAGRALDKEKLMEGLRSLGYM